MATSSTDANAYGHLYQWGRGSDGHQKRTSRNTNILSTSDTPEHDSFILAPYSPYDWRKPQNDDLWQGLSGINNPCPGEYRLPTQAEWNTERLSWSTNNSAGAYASPLKLTLAGYRDANHGSLTDVNLGGYYWSSTVGGDSSWNLGFTGSLANKYGSQRAKTCSVRCIKN